MYTREDALKELQDANNFDTECAHVMADNVLCKLLVSLGYSDVVEAWENINKWYA